MNRLHIYNLYDLTFKSNIYIIFFCFFHFLFRSQTFFRLFFFLLNMKSYSNSNRNTRKISKTNLFYKEWEIVRE